MADRYYGIAVGGQGPVDVLAQASTTSRAIELRVNDSVLTAGRVDKKRFVVEAVEAILLAVQQDSI